MACSKGRIGTEWRNWVKLKVAHLKWWQKKYMRSDWGKVTDGILEEERKELTWKDKEGNEWKGWEERREG